MVKHVFLLKRKQLYRHPGPLRSELKVSKACLAPKAPRKAQVARLLESADLRFSTGYEAKLFNKDRKAKVSKALGLAGLTSQFGLGVLIVESAVPPGAPGTKRELLGRPGRRFRTFI